MSLDYVLKTGEIVEVLTQKNKKPSRDWLRAVHTSFARKKVKHELNIRDQKERVVPFRALELTVTVENRVGMLRDTTAVLSAHDCDIQKVTSGVTSDKFATISFLCNFRGRGVPSALIIALKKIRGVREVEYKTTN